MFYLNDPRPGAWLEIPRWIGACHLLTGLRREVCNSTQASEVKLFIMAANSIRHRVCCPYAKYSIVPNNNSLLNCFILSTRLIKYVYRQVQVRRGVNGNCKSCYCYFNLVLHAYNLNIQYSTYILCLLARGSETEVSSRSHKARPHRSTLLRLVNEENCSIVDLHTWFNVEVRSIRTDKIESPCLIYGVHSGNMNEKLWDGTFYIFLVETYLKKLFNLPVGMFETNNRVFSWRGCIN